MSCVCCGTKASRLPSFGLQHSPPWLLSFLFALQHLLVLGSMLCTCHYLLLQSRPLAPTEQSRLLASSLFACGIATGLQSTVGTRLPLVQTPTFELLIPALTLSQHLAAERTPGNDTQGSPYCAGKDCDRPLSTQHLITQVSGAVLVSGALQMVFGVSGLLGLILRRCGPMVKAPALFIIGLSSYKQAALFCSFSWVVSLLVILITGLLSQTFRSCHLPIYLWNRKKGETKQYIPAMRMFSMFVPILCTWGVCSALRTVAEREGIAGAVRSAGNGSTSLAANPFISFAVNGGNSTDPSAWFQIPSLGGWGWPQFTPLSVCVGVAMALTSSLTSFGCYLLCDRMVRCPSVPSQACNRGICMEGVGNILSGLLGSVCGAGSSIPNIGMAGITQVGSRHPVQLCALLMVALGCSPKLAGLLMDIPFAVHGAVLCLTYSMALGGGISYFQYADIDSGRNVFIVGFTTFIALLVPRWLQAAPGILLTGWPPLDLLLMGLLCVPIFLGGLSSFLLDNTVSGSLRERGLLSGLAFGNPVPQDQAEELTHAYGLPFHHYCLFPAVYPCNQLCPRPLERLDPAEGEEDKLLKTALPVTGAERG
ncbi:solute carrier family 23 member 3 [Spea bombifrons]|uniref:solute carrier family 23 member 3 n=1 Tax=Spea bombifrons TaxID=233779 RepID=UPI00234A461B|nr:solute carrier family 23 member 3 [Spea bombifrons]